MKQVYFEEMREAWDKPYKRVILWMDDKFYLPSLVMIKTGHYERDYVSVDSEDWYILRGGRGNFPTEASCIREAMRLFDAKVI